MKRQAFYYIFLFSLFGIYAPRTLASSPKQEMRATWLTTVDCIDWPKAFSPVNQKKEMIKMLDSIRSLKLNTVFFQIRSCCDAMYNSAYEPWSDDLRNHRGVDPGYDPLAFVVEACHERGLSCHAWINPYRYGPRGSGSGWTGNNNHPLNYENTHPGWLLWYDKSVILDPALPEVRFRIKSVVGDILSKYDVDGIVFDDYFYPYGGTTTQDAASVAAYKPAGMNVHDWRRSNINQMVADVYDTIQSVKPWVTFGISPFGIWTTSHAVAAQEGIPLPAGITGGNMYQEIYCDPIAWLKAGTVDYISPQLYWKIGGGQDYATLCPWWADVANSFGRHFYSSMAIYKYSEGKGYTVNELAAQSDINRNSSKGNAPGHVFYNTLGWVYDQAFRNKFRKSTFATRAIWPAVNWKACEDYGMVTFQRPEGQKILWKHDQSDVLRFVVYAVPQANRNDPHVFHKSDYVLDISYATEYILPAGITTSSHKIAVAALDRYGNEHSLRVMGETLIEEPVPTTLIAPEKNATRKLPITFQWEPVNKADSYLWQLARDVNFKDIVCTHETENTLFYSSTRKHLKAGGKYYWRVKTRKANVNDCWSETREISFETNNATDNAHKDSIKAYMNQDILIIETTEPSEAQIDIYNVSGSLLFTGRYALHYGQNEIRPHTETWAPGIYLVRMQTAHQVQTLKIKL